MHIHEQRNATLGIEFDRYVMDHPAFAARIPRGAQVVLQLHDDPRFNAWARRVARSSAAAKVSRRDPHTMDSRSGTASTTDSHKSAMLYVVTT